MTAANRTCDTKIARQKYEVLRANALSSINRAPGFTLFLRSGMSAWMRALAGQGSVQRKIDQQTASVFTPPDAGMLGADLVSILTDAILNAAATARYHGEITHERTHTITP